MRRHYTIPLPRRAQLLLGPRTLVMGILNITPDSFADGGLHFDVARAVEAGAQMEADGADIIDVGGESTRPGAEPLPAGEELRRVIPVIRGLAARVRIPISIDTYKAEVARAAIDSGASIVNDISGLRDAGLADVCARTGAALVLMHTRTAPKSKLLDPDLYDDVVEDVIGFLRERMEVAASHGVTPEQILIDPGPDFAKTPAQTLEVLARLTELHVLERPILLAISRKDALGALTGRGPRERLAGTLAALADGADRGAHMARIHDVREATDFLAVRGALRGRLQVQRDLHLPESLRRVAPSDGPGR